MNVYGERARDFMRLHSPTRFSAISDPEAFFTKIGEEIASQVDELEETLAGPAPADEGYVERMGRLGMARLMAEERVLSELVYSTAESQEDEPATDETGAFVGGRPGWEPLIPPEPAEDEG